MTTGEKFVCFLGFVIVGSLYAVSRISRKKEEQ